MNTEEQRLDIIHYCDLLLEGFLSEFSQTDNTAQGRMITQCQWLKERAENHDLPLPLDRGKLGSLLYIYTNGEMYNIDLSINEKVKMKYDFDDVELYQHNLVGLASEGRLLLKPPYHPYALRYIDALIHLLENAPRELEDFEKNAIPELKTMRKLLEAGKIEPPLGSSLPDYPNFNQIDMYRASIEDMPKGKELAKTTADLIFNGVRPDSWLTPEDADRETQQLL